MTPADPRSDADLLTAFRHDRDEPAFAELVRRHGPTVWAACRRRLPDPADAEDVFQAAFVVLVRKADRLRAVHSFGPWLYRVAALTARNVRRKNARRLARRAEWTGDYPAAPDPPAVDDILLSLPEADRGPLVLVYLYGYTRAEPAGLLRVPEGTLNARVSRALAKLRDRFVAPAAVAVPAVLVDSTVATAAVARVAAFAAVSPTVFLAEGVLRMAWLKPTCAAGLAAAALLVTGVGVRFQHAAAEDPKPFAKAEPGYLNTPEKGMENLSKDLQTMFRRNSERKEPWESQRKALVTQELAALKLRKGELQRALAELERRENELDRELKGLTWERPAHPYLLLSIGGEKSATAFAITQFEDAKTAAFTVPAQEFMPIRKFVEHTRSDPLYRAGYLIVRLETDGPSVERVRTAVAGLIAAGQRRAVFEIPGEGKPERRKKVPADDLTKLDVEALCKDAAAFRAAK